MRSATRSRAPTSRHYRERSASTRTATSRTGPSAYSDTSTTINILSMMFFTNTTISEWHRKPPTRPGWRRFERVFDNKEGLGARLAFGEMVAGRRTGGDNFPGREIYLGHFDPRRARRAVAAGNQRAEPRRDVRAAGNRLYARLRHHGVDQFRPFQRLYDRVVSRHVGARVSWAVRPELSSDRAGAVRCTGLCLCRSDAGLGRARDGDRAHRAAPAAWDPRHHRDDHDDRRVLH